MSLICAMALGADVLGLPGLGKSTLVGRMALGLTTSP